METFENNVEIKVTTNNHTNNSINIIIKAMFIILLPLFLLLGALMKIIEYIYFFLKIVFLGKIKNDHETDKITPLENI